MNKSYRTIWNASTGTWIAASELSKARRKSTRIRATVIAANAGIGVIVGMSGSNAMAAQFYVNDLGGGTQDGQCAQLMDGASLGSAASLKIVNSSYCNISTVAGLSGSQAGTMVLNRSGAFLNGPMSIAGSLDVNGNKVINVAAGTAATDAVNVQQLNDAVASGSPYVKVNGTGTAATANGVAGIAIGNAAVANGVSSADGSSTAVGASSTAGGNFSSAFGALAVAGSSTAGAATAIGNRASAGGDRSTALGASSNAAGSHATALGVLANASGINGVAVGSEASAQGDYTLAIGSGARATRASSNGTSYYDYAGMAIGTGATALGGNNIALGRNASATGVYEVTAIGANASATAAFATVLGSGANARADSGVAVGKGASVTAYGAVALGTGSVADRANTVSVGSASQTRQITNVAAATQDNDAVNLRQLKNSGLVGDDGSGNLTSLAVSYDSAAKDKVTLGGANSTTPVTLSNVAAGAADTDAVNVGQLKGSGLVGDDGSGNLTSLAVSYDSAAKDKVTLGGASSTTPVTLSNVADGVDDHDAVNVGQLTNSVNQLRDDLSDGTIDMKYIKVNATGTQANALGTNAVAIGASANATANGALAMGTGSRATGLNSVALGYNSVATQANTVSVGSAGNERKIVNVAGGDINANSTDAVNGSQLYDALNSLQSQIQTQAAPTGLFGVGTLDVQGSPVAIEGYAGTNVASLNGADPTSTAVAMGASSQASGADTVAVGVQAVAQSNNSVALGSRAQTGYGQEYSVAVGADAQTNGTQAIALGSHVQANADNAVAVGNNDTWALGAGSTAIGNSAKVRAGAVNGIALGTGANVATNVADAIAIGTNASVDLSAHGSVALGAGSVANRSNALSVGNAASTRQIINVKAGTQSTDAVNLSQLAGVATALGGNANINPDGSILAPSYTVGAKTYDNVGDALSALANGGSTDPFAVTYDSASKDKVTLGGANSTTPVTLSNVAAGAADTDAVNIGQLKGSGLVGDDGSGNLTSLAVSYDSAAKDK
ncbi:autotransporter adhesin, partial [Burkholderia ambifaria]|nr:autotransporter adhesin [Burkholderia ambifaria]